MIINDPIFRTTRHPHSAKRHWSLSSTESISELEPLNRTCQIMTWIDVARHDVCTRNCGFTWPWLYHSCFHVVSLVSYTFMFMAYPVLDVRLSSQKAYYRVLVIFPPIIRKTPSWNPSLTHNHLLVATPEKTSVACHFYK